MSNQAFERYKEALRQGHLAALGGDHAAAAAAYGEAGRLAPDRPLPHVGQGAALRQLGQYAEALAAFDAALVIAPLDEAALRGRGAALMALGRPVEASAALTGLAESLEADGRLAEALELAHEALALAAAPFRFRLVARLSAALRTAGARSGEPSRTEAREPGEDRDPGAAARNRATRATRMSAIGVTLMADAESLADAGRLDDARERYVMAARSHYEGGRVLAALDACYQALAIVPADPDLHLVLVELYEEQGWPGLAAEKLRLVLRLADETGDGEARDRTCALAAALYPGNVALAAASR